MQIQIIEIKKEKSLTQQAIMKAKSKIANLEDQVGYWKIKIKRYANTEFNLLFTKNLFFS